VEIMLSSTAWMSDTISKCRPFSFILNSRNKAILEIEAASSSALSRVYALLLLVICQESGNKFRGNAAHVQIFC
jgi:hypothetical protein